MNEPLTQVNPDVDLNFGTDDRNPVEPDTEPPWEEPGTEDIQGPESAIEEPPDPSPTELIEETEEKRSLPVPLSKEDRLKYGGELATAYQDLVTLKAKKKVWVANTNDKIKTTRETAKALSALMVNGQHNVETPVRRVVDRTGEKPIVTITRLDTNIVVSAGPLEDEEDVDELQLEDAE